MATVRIDDELLEKIKVLIEMDENKYKYPSVSAFINNSIYEKLKKEDKNV